jgi:hypothetical protein
MNADNMENVRHKASIYFRNKRREYHEDNINDLATHDRRKK